MKSPRYLHHNCWDIIINHLNLNNQADQQHLDRLSLVSKELLSVTNQHLECLKLFDRTKRAVPSYLNRFPYLKMINLSDCLEDIKALLHDLAHSDLDLQGLDLSKQYSLPLESLTEIALTKGNFRILKCSMLSMLRDPELIAIGNIFPSLEELDISYPSNGSSVSDESIIALSTKLSNLAKINLSGNFSLSNECLKSLSLNSKKLEEVILQHCRGMTKDGVSFLVGTNPNLAVLSIAISGGISSNSDIPFANLRLLNTLELSYMEISDQVLAQIADAKMPLKKFYLCHCYGYSFNGLAHFLDTYNSLEFIAFTKVDFFNDLFLAFFCKFFKRATSIKLNCCPKLTDQALSILWGACPRLEKLEMSRTGIGHDNARGIFRVNSKLEYLNLSGNRLWGKTTKRFALLFPNITYLNLSYGTFVSNDIIDILENCKKLRHLNINWCREINIKDFTGTSKFERLEILEAATSLTDKSVMLFAKRSPALRCLNLMYCHTVTAVALKEIITHCEHLIDINIKGCNVTPRFVRWMIYHRPLLRRIVSSDFPPDRSSLNSFRTLGCSFCRE